MGGWGANSPMFRQLLRTKKTRSWMMIMIFLNTWDSIIPELIINQQGSWTLLMSIYPYEHFNQNDAYFSGVKTSTFSIPERFVTISLSRIRTIFGCTVASNSPPAQPHDVGQSPTAPTVPTTSWGIAVTEERSRARPTFWMSTPSMVTEPSVGSTVRRRILQRNNANVLFGQVGGPRCLKHLKSP